MIVISMPNTHRDEFQLVRLISHISDALQLSFRLSCACVSMYLSSQIYTQIKKNMKHFPNPSMYSIPYYRKHICPMNELMHEATIHSIIRRKTVVFNRLATVNKSNTYDSTLFFYEF